MIFGAIAGAVVGLMFAWLWSPAGELGWFVAYEVLGIESRAAGVATIGALIGGGLALCTALFAWDD